MHSNGPVALAGSLSQPICSSSLTDSTLAAYVTARLPAQGGCPLGIREENPKARTSLGRTRRGWLAVGTLPASACPLHHVAGPAVGSAKYSDDTSAQCLVPGPLLAPLWAGSPGRGGDTGASDS